MPTEGKDGCVKCDDSEYVLDGKCLPDPSTSSAEEAIGGVFANEGTPFYTLVILVLLMAFLALMVYQSKATKESTLLQFSLLTHVTKSSLPFAGFVSEMILAVGAFSSGLNSLQACASVLLLSRFLVAIPPGLATMRNSIFGGKLPVINPATKKKNIKYYLDEGVISLNSRVYSALLVLSLFEPMLLQFLPWWKTELSEVADFPTIEIMTMVFGFKAAQLLVTFGAQVAILIIVGHYDSTFGIIAILNIIFSLITLSMRGWDMVVKRGILRNSAKSDDCEAARRALGIDHASTSSVTDNTRLELGTIYTENPLLEGQSVLPNSRHDAGDTDSFLIRRVELQEQRVQQQEQRVQEQEQRAQQQEQRAQEQEQRVQEQEQRAQQQEQRVQEQEQTIHEYSRRTEALEALIRQHLPQVEQSTISVSSNSENIT